MAKEYRRNESVVVNKKETPKKKHKCCTCILVFFIVFIIVIGIGVGVGWYFGDKFTKQNFGMSLGDCFGVIGDIKKSEENKVISADKKYTDADALAFENEIKKQLFLNENADLNVDELLSIFLSNDTTANSAKTLDKNSLLYKTLATLGENDLLEKTSAVSTESGLNIDTGKLLNYIGSLYTKSNMNFEGLKGYNEDRHQDYILNVNDKQLAAFLNKVLVLGLDKLSINGDKSLSSITALLGDVKLSEAVKIEQVAFSGSSDEPNMKFSVSLKARDIANSYLKELTNFPFNWATWMVLPKKIFLTVDVKLSETAECDLYINNMDDAKMARLFKLIDGVMNFASSPIENGVEAELETTLSKYVTPVSKVIKDYTILDEVSTGSIKMDLIQTGLSFIPKEGVGAVASDITSSDIIYTLKYVLTSELASDLNEFAFKHLYKNVETGKVEYHAANPGDRYQLMDYENLLMKELSDKYLIDFKIGTEHERNFADLMGLLGIGTPSPDSGELIDWIDPTKLEALAATEGNNALVINDKMLAAMLSSNLSNLLGSNETIAKLNPEIFAVSLIEEEKDSVTKHYLKVALNVSLMGIFGDNQIVNVLKEVLPLKIMITLKMEITLNTAPDYVFDKVGITLNDLTQEETDKLFELIKKLGVNFSLDDITNKIQEPIKNALNEMNKALPGISFGTSAVNLTSLFDVIADTMLTDSIYTENGETRALNGADLKEIVNGIYNTSGISDIEIPENNYSNFMRDMKSKYFIKGAEDINTYKELIERFSVGSNFNSDLIYVDKLAHTNETKENLKPFISSKELASLMRGIINDGTNASLANFSNITNMTFKKVAQNEIMSLSVKIKMKDVIGNEQSDLTKILVKEEIFVTLNVNLSKTENHDFGAEGIKPYYVTTLQINNMSNITYNKLISMINSFNASEGINFEEKAKDIGKIMYEQLKEFEDKMGGKIEVVTDRVGGTDESGMRMASIFEMLATSVSPKNGNAYSEAVVRSALQGLYDKNSSGENSDYNYDASKFASTLMQYTSIKTQPGATSGTEYYIPDVELGDLLSSGGQISVGNGMPNISIASIIQSAGTMALSQLNIYPAHSGLRLPSTDFGATSWYNSATDANNDYFEFVFKLKTANGSGSATSIQELLPETINVSFVFKKTSSGLVAVDIANNAANPSYFRINNMTKAAQDIVFSIANIQNIDIDNQLGALTNNTELTKLFNLFEIKTVTIDGKTRGKLTVTLPI